MKRTVAGVAALVLLTTSTAVAQGTSCSIDRGERIVLKSKTIDPNVFVWDRKDLMIAYATGVWPGPKTVLQHAFLSSPGTVGVAIACDASAVRPKNAIATQDAVAIRITDGPHRGRSGWVASDDVHVLRRL
jgi:hypothetical protein